ncbi:2'-5' RNA ligase family protein [Flavobacterium sp.]|jgi:2'-5' RNA ligase|uniref:2'-5' RNA ligase family protein n=1 Tax=Flavobacterium sp. TaxID=239 RepID=UPI002A82313C|nr:2'-5' RNA ligase family protein [Flavobacterium sp.]
MEKKYAIAFHPSEEIIEKVKQIKLDLASKIGWYNSKNSLAHITISKFKLHSTKIELVSNELGKICKHIQPVDVILSKFSSYPNGTFYLCPNDLSSLALKKLMKQINTSLSIKLSYKSTNPHLSIARKLETEKLETAIRSFSCVDLNFLCDTVIIRELDLEKGQYKIVKQFKLEGQTPINQQGVLF